MIDNLIALIQQDLVGLGVQLFFAYTILLMVFDAQKPPVQTAVLTGLALIVFGFGGSFVSPVTAGLSVLNGIFWLILAYQRYTQ